MSRGSFLSRWSRLKQEAREKEASPTVAPPEPEAEEHALPEAPPEKAAAGADASEGAAEPVAEAPPPDLPDIETLTRDSDYTGFLRKEVPKALQRQALRKLWRSDPVFANLDGLNDYDEDFSKPAIVGKAVKTSFDALRGYAPAEPEPVQAAVDENVVEDEVEATPGDGKVEAQDAGEVPGEVAEEATETPDGPDSHAAVPHEENSIEQAPQKPHEKG